MSLLSILFGRRENGKHRRAGRGRSRDARHPSARGRKSAKLGLEGLEARALLTVLYWDPDGASAGNDYASGANLGGNGAWNAASAWVDSSGTRYQWDATHAGDDAVFWGTAGTVSLGGPISAQSVSFKTTAYSVADAANTLTLNGTGQINVDPDLFDTLSAALGGSAGLTKIGTGTLTLSGPNTFTGDTNVNGGLLRLGADNAAGSGTASVAAGATLDLCGYSQSLAGLAGGGTVTSTGLNGPTYFTTNAASGISSTKTYTHLLDFIADGAPATVNGVAFTAAATSGANWSTSGLTGTVTEGSGAATAPTFPDAPNGTAMNQLYRDFYYNGSPGTLTLSGLTVGTTYEARLYLRNWGGPRFQTMNFDEDGAGPLGSTLHFNEDGSTVPSYLSYRFTAVTTSLVIKATADGGSGTFHWYGASVEVAAPTTPTLTLGGAGSSQFDGVLGGAITLVKQGAGTQTLTGTNTYRGPTTIAAGTLQIGSGGASGTLGSGNVTDNGTLTFNRSDTFQVNLVISGSGGVTKEGNGTLILGSTNPYAGDSVVNGGTLKLTTDGAAGSGAASVAAGATLDLGAYTQTFKGLSGGGTVTSSTAARGPVFFTTNADSGISPAKTYTHLLDFGNNAGAFVNGVAFANVGTGSGTGWSVAGAVNVYNETPGTSPTFSDAADGTAMNRLYQDFIFNGSPAVLTLSGFTAGTTYDVRLYNRAFGVGGSRWQTMVFDEDGAGPASSQIRFNEDASATPSYVSYLFTAVTDGAGGALPLTITITPDIAANTYHMYGVSAEVATAGATLTVGGAANYRFDGRIVGAVALVKQGAGTQTLAGANTYAGDTTLREGTLQLGAADAIPNGAGKGNVVLTPGAGRTATLDLNGFTDVINGLSSSGPGTSRVDNTAAAPGTLTVGDADRTAVFAGALDDTGANLNLVKIGAGTQTLAGTGTASGGTAVNAGTLLLAADNAAGQGTCFVNAGAILNLGSFSQTLGGLTGAGDVVNAARYAGPTFFTTNAGSGIDPAKTYTHLLDFVADGAPATVNGAAFLAAGTTGPNWSLTGITNTMNEGGGDAYDPLMPDAPLNTAMHQLGRDFYYGGNPALLTLSGFTPGAGYELRLYDHAYGGARVQTMVFDEDGSGPISNTVTYDENQLAPDYISYRFTAYPDGAGGALPLTVKVTPAVSTTTYHWYGLSVEQFATATPTLTVGDGGNYQFDGSFGGLVNLVKQGSGTLTLNGSTPATIAPTIAAGTLQIGDGGMTGTLDAPSIVDDGSLVIDRSDTIVLPGAISGTGGLTQQGTGMLILAGPASISGPTTVAAGELKINNPYADAVSRYALDGTPGAITPPAAIADSVGGLDGTLAAAGATFVTGRYGQAISLTGTQQVAVPYNAALDLSTYSVNAWFNVPGTGGTRGILGTRTGGDNTFDVKLVNGGTSIHGDFGDGAGNWISTTADMTGLTITTNVWHMVTYVIDGANQTYDLYFDGVRQVGPVAFTGTPKFMRPTSILTIGNTNGAEPMNGSIDDVAIFNAALDAGRVAALYDARVGGLSPNSDLAVAAGATLDLDDTRQTAASLADYAGGGGTITNSATLNASLTSTQSASTTFSGVFQDGGGTMGLTLAGGGTLTLAGDSTLTGPTIIAAGTLHLGAGGLTGALGTSPITDDAELVFNRGGVAVLPNVIGGTGNVTQAGPGVLTLTGMKTYGGSTTISAGTLRLAPTAAAPLLNAGFETPTVPPIGYQYTPLTADWTFDTLSGLAKNGSVWYTPLAPEGIQAAFVQNASTISQTADVPSAGTYAISFRAVGRPGGTHGPDNLALEVDGVQVGYWPASSFDVASWDAFRVDVVLATGPHTITFQGTTPGGDRATCIDDVSIVGVDNQLPTTTAVRITGAGASLDLNDVRQTVGSLGCVAGSTVTLGQGVLTMGADNSSTALAGVISDLGGASANTGGAIVKQGAGTLTVSAANTYGGDTTISQGTFLLAASEVIPDGAGHGNVILNPAVGQSATLDLGGFDETINGLSSPGAGSAAVDNTAAGPVTLTAGGNDATSTYSGAIRNTGGPLGLTKIGAGTLTLTHPNTFTGDATVNGGVLKLGADGAAGMGSAAINAGGTLDLATYNQTFRGISGSGLVTTTSVAAGPIFFTTNAGSGISSAKTYLHKLDFIADGAPAAVNSVVFTAAGISGANWSLTNAPSNISEAGGAASAPTFPDAPDGTGMNQLYRDFYYGGPTETLTLTGFTAGQIYEVRLYNRYWGGPRPQTLTFDEDGAGPISNTLSFDQDGSQTPNYLSYRFTAVSNGTGGTLPLVITVVAGVPGYTYHFYAVTSERISLSEATLTVGDAGDYQFDGTIQNPVSLAKQGSGRLTLTGTNTYSGTTTIADGTLQIGAGGATGTLGSGDVTDDAALVFDRGNTLAVGNTIGGSGSLTQAGAGTLTLAAANSYTGDTNVLAGRLRLGADGAAGLGAAFIDSGALLDMAIYNQAFKGLSGGGDVVASSAVFGQTFFTTNAASGIDPAKTYTHLLDFIADGTPATVNGVTFTAADRTGPNWTLAGAPAQITEAGGAANSPSFPDAPDGTGMNQLYRDFYYNGSPATLTLSGFTAGSFYEVRLYNRRWGGPRPQTMTFDEDGAGPISNVYTFDEDGSAIPNYVSYRFTAVSDGAGGALPLTITAVLGNPTFTYHFYGLSCELVTSPLPTLTLGDAADYQFDGTISGPIDLVKQNAGTQTLTGANAYSGATTVDGGFLGLGHDEVLGTGAVTIHAGGLSVAAGGGWTVSNPISLLATPATVDTTGGDLTLAGLIAGAGGLTKAGPHTLSLTAANAYAGPTAVSGGTLAVNGDQTAAHGVATVSNGATLTGAGTVGGPVTVQPGGRVAPGDGPGRLTVASSAGVTFGALSHLVLELGGTNPGVDYDQLSVNGPVNLNGGTLDASTILGFLPTAGSFVVVDTLGGQTISGTFAGLPQGGLLSAGGLTFQIDYQPTQVVLNRVGPQVTQVVHDAGDPGTADDAQRSTITRLMVYFSGQVTVGPTAFLLERTGAGGGTVGTTFTTAVVNGVTVATIRFSGGFTYAHGAANALSDGNYRLTIDGGQVADVTSMTATNRTDDFFRLFGDSDGDGDVDAADLNLIRRVMAGDARYAAYRAAFDYDGNNVVDALDYRQFRLRYGRHL